MSFYKKIEDIFSNVFNSSSIDYDIIEAVKYDKKSCGLKFWIENAGTYLVETYISDLVDELETIKKDIINSPLTCPFCKATEFKENSCSCGAIITKSIRDVNNIIVDKTNFYFEDISNLLECADDNISEIIEGVSVQYCGLESEPYYFISQNISMISQDKITDEYQDLYWFFRLILSNKYKLNKYKDYNSELIGYYLKSEHFEIGFNDIKHFYSDDSLFISFPMDHFSFFKSYKNFFNLNDSEISDKHNDYILDLQCELTHELKMFYFDIHMGDEYFIYEFSEDDKSNYKKLKEKIEYLKNNYNEIIIKEWKEALKNIDLEERLEAIE